MFCLLTVHRLLTDSVSDYWPMHELTVIFVLIVWDQISYITALLQETSAWRLLRYVWCSCAITQKSLDAQIYVRNYLEKENPNKIQLLKAIFELSGAVTEAACM